MKFIKKKAGISYLFSWHPTKQPLSIIFYKPSNLYLTTPEMKISILLPASIAASSASSRRDLQSESGGGCKCEGDVEYVFNHVQDTWMIHYLIAQSRGCELASISGPDEQFQALSTAALGWQLFAENTTRNIQAAWIGGKRISADGGGRTTNGTVDESPWRWTDGSAWGWTNW